MQQENSNLFKIGFSHKEKTRKNILQTGNPEKIIIVNTFETKTDGRQLEVAVHAHYRLKHYRGEWFELNTQDIKEFLDVCTKLENSIMFLKNSGNYFF